ncbi:ATP-dependent DNA helicase recG domain protein [Mycobacterium ulcerans str. Harvey]|uniref:ATP-dependent DNA helicase recG domain protein n=1 Tax=Mycobacterium ulcerans str. Harvey TaxID=1299332 RepID=A0ABN0R065_MYCUL|nr:ATP-dependent DNA helicase recG domain protein [Mycobacterium ulcerans str. Harvey]
MVALSDRLDFVLGAKAAEALDEEFGIRTVDDLLRHYPRSYVEGGNAAAPTMSSPKWGSTSPSSMSSPKPSRFR